MSGSSVPVTCPSKNAHSVSACTALVSSSPRGRQVDVETFTNKGLVSNNDRSCQTPTSSTSSSSYASGSGSGSSSGSSSSYTYNVRHRKKDRTSTTYMDFSENSILDDGSSSQSSSIRRGIQPPPSRYNREMMAAFCENAPIMEIDSTQNSIILPVTPSDDNDDDESSSAYHSRGPLATHCQKSRQTVHETYSTATPSIFGSTNNNTHSNHNTSFAKRGIETSMTSKKYNQPTQHQLIISIDPEGKREPTNKDNSTSNEATTMQQPCATPRRINSQNHTEEDSTCTDETKSLATPETSRICNTTTLSSQDSLMLSIPDFRDPEGLSPDSSSPTKLALETSSDHDDRIARICNRYLERNTNTVSTQKYANETSRFGVYTSFEAEDCNEKRRDPNGGNWMSAPKSLDTLIQSTNLDTQCRQTARVVTPTNPTFSTNEDSCALVHRQASFPFSARNLSSDAPDDEDDLPPHGRIQRHMSFSGKYQAEEISQNNSKPLLSNCESRPTTTFSWRMDPSKSLSDWRLEIFNQSTKHFQSYHVHRVVLCVGVKASGYFERALQSRRKNNTVLRIPLMSGGCDLFPCFLDYMYSLPTFTMSTSTAVGLAYLSSIFEQPLLLRESMDFVYQDLTVTSMHQYLSDAVYYDQHELVEWILDLAADSLPKIKREDARNILQEMTTSKFQTVLERVNHTQLDESQSERMSNLLVDFCIHHRHAVTIHFLEHCNQTLPRLALDSVLALLDLVLTLGEPASQLQDRCLLTVVENWLYFCHTDEFSSIIGRLLSAHSKVVSMWIPRMLSQANQQLLQSHSNLNLSWEQHAATRKELEQTKTELEGTYNELMAVRRILDSTKTELRSQLEGMIQKRNSDKIMHQEAVDYWQQERKVWKRERQVLLDERNRLEGEVQALQGKGGDTGIDHSIQNSTGRRDPGLREKTKPQEQERSNQKQNQDCPRSPVSYLTNFGLGGVVEDDEDSIGINPL